MAKVSSIQKNINRRELVKKFKNKRSFVINVTSLYSLCLRLRKRYEISNKFREVKTSVDKIRNKSVRLENLDVEKKAIDKI